jgi:selenocysteine-specific elongation factor
MFRRPARSASRGDRAALLVPGLDAAALERGLAAAPGSVPTLKGAVAEVERVRFYAGGFVGWVLLWVSCVACTAVP